MSFFTSFAGIKSKNSLPVIANSPIADDSKILLKNNAKFNVKDTVLEIEAEESILSHELLYSLEKKTF